MDEVIYWECHYINCEGKETWSHAKTPADWSEDDVSGGLMGLGRSGDDPAEFLYAVETDDNAESSMYYDFT